MLFSKNQYMFKLSLGTENTYYNIIQFVYDKLNNNKKNYSFLRFSF